MKPSKDIYGKIAKITSGALLDTMNKMEMKTDENMVNGPIARFDVGNPSDPDSVVLAIIGWIKNHPFNQETLFIQVEPLVPILSRVHFEKLITEVGSRPLVLDYMISLLDRKLAMELIPRCLHNDVMIPRTIKKLCRRDDLVEKCLSVIRYERPYHGPESTPRDQDMSMVIPYILDGADINHIDSDGHSFWFRVVKKWLDSCRPKEIDPCTIPAIIIRLGYFISTITAIDILELSTYPRFGFLPHFDTDLSDYKDEKGRNLLQKLVDEIDPNISLLLALINEKREWVRRIPNIDEIITAAEDKKMGIVTKYLKIATGW